MSVNVKTPEGLLQIAGKGSGGSTSPEIETKLEELESLIEQTRTLRADLESYGMVKLSSASNITDSNGLALPATEKNASINGTLASRIESIATYTSLGVTSHRIKSGIKYNLYSIPGNENPYSFNTFLVFGSQVGAEKGAIWIISCNTGVFIERLTETDYRLEVENKGNHTITIKQTLGSSAIVMGVNSFACTPVDE